MSDIQFFTVGAVVMCALNLVGLCIMVNCADAIRDTMRLILDREESRAREASGGGEDHA